MIRSAEYELFSTINADAIYRNPKLLGTKTKKGLKSFLDLVL